MIRMVQAADLKVGDIMALSMGKTATILGVYPPNPREHKRLKFVQIKTEFGMSRLEVSSHVTLEWKDVADAELSIATRPEQIAPDDYPHATDREVAYEFLTLCVKMAPNGIVQQAFSNMYNNMQVDGLEWRDIVLQMVGSLWDGLRYGNWPILEPSKLVGEQQK